MIRIAVLDDYQHVARSSADWSEVEARAVVTMFDDHLETEDALIDRLRSFDAICVMRERTPLTADVLARLPNLKFIGSNGPRNASIDGETAKRRGIAVSSTDGRGNGAPEMTWALILASARRLPEEVAFLRAGGWQTHLGADLDGKTLGIVGLGRVGRQVAAVGRAFGMNVIAWSENLTAADAEDAGVARVEKDQLFREADWVSLHLVLSQRTKGVVGEPELAAMKGSAWLVNTARGPLVDEAALIDAVGRRMIAGAALDVFDVEPLPAEHPFRTLPNVIATPHLGFVTRDTYATFYGQTVENLLAWMEGVPIRTE